MSREDVDTNEHKFRIKRLLHWLVVAKADLKTIRNIYKLDPTALLRKIPTKCCSSKAFPQSLLYVACICGAQEGVVEFLADMDPRAVSKPKQELPISMLVLNNPETHSASLSAVKKLLEIYPKGLFDNLFVDFAIHYADLDQEVMDFLIHQWGSSTTSSNSLSFGRRRPIKSLHYKGHSMDPKATPVILPLVQRLAIEYVPEGISWSQILDCLAGSQSFLEDLCIWEAFPPGRAHEYVGALQKFLTTSCSVEDFKIVLDEDETPESSRLVVAAICDALNTLPNSNDTLLTHLEIDAEESKVPAKFVASMLEAGSMVAALESVTWLGGEGQRGCCHCHLVDEIEFNDGTHKPDEVWNLDYQSDKMILSEEDNVLNTLLISLENGIIGPNWVEELLQHMSNTFIRRLLLQGIQIDALFVLPIYNIQHLEHFIISYGCVVSGAILCQFLSDCHISSLEICHCEIAGPWTLQDGNAPRTISPRLKHFMFQNVFTATSEDKDYNEGLLYHISGMHSLDTFGIYFPEGEGADGTDALVSLLSANNLKTLYLCVESVVENWGKVCGALETNTSLKRLFIGRMEQSSLEGLADLLAEGHNTSLGNVCWEGFYTGEEEETSCKLPVLQKIGYFAELNFFGRGQARALTTSATAFVTLLATVAEDPDLDSNAKVGLHYGLLHESSHFLGGWKYS